MKTFFHFSIFACILAAASLSPAAEVTSDTTATAATTSPAIPLWPEGPPGALGARDTDIPTLTPWLAPADKATGAAIIVCPGGGYAGLAPSEGSDYARWLNELGISAFVLKYRLASSGYHHPAMLNDATRAMRMVRAHAAEWKVDSTRIGIIGSSAGGHLASTLLTHFDSGDPTSTDTIERQSSRPDLGILCYPVITMGDLTHAGSRHNLLGDSPSADLVKLLSNEEQVTSNTPETFIFHTADDKVVPVQNSLLFANALATAGVSFEFHVYPHGNHGMGLGSFHNWDPEHRHAWVKACQVWLHAHHFAR